MTSSQERLLDACRLKGPYRHHHILSPLLDRISVAKLFSETLAVHAEWLASDGKTRSEAGERYQSVHDAVIKADKNILAEVILNSTPRGAVEIGEAGDILMRAYRTDRDDERPPLRPELRAQIIERLAVWSSTLVNDAAASRHALHHVAEAIATFPSTSLLDPLRSLLAADLARWRREKKEIEATIARRERPDPASGAHMSYAFRYAQDMLSLAKGRDADM